jgi:hypothetical protein
MERTDATQFKIDEDDARERLFRKTRKRLSAMTPEWIRSVGGTERAKRAVESYVSSLETLSDVIMERNTGLRLPKIGRSEDYVYIGMLQHTLYPQLGDNLEYYNLHNDTYTNFSTRTPHKSSRFFYTLPEDVYILDVVDVGGGTRTNMLYENILFQKGVDMHRILQGHLKSILNRDDSRTDVRDKSTTLAKYIEKNAKYYFPGNTCINYTVYFEPFVNRHNLRWLFFKKEHGDAEFTVIDDAVTSTDPAAQSRLRRFHDDTKEGIEDYMLMSSVIERLRRIYPRKKLVFMPISCRDLPTYSDYPRIPAKKTLAQGLPRSMRAYFGLEQLYLTMIQHILMHGRNNFKTLSAGHDTSDIATPHHYKDVYEEFFVIYRENRKTFIGMKEHSFQRLFLFLRQIIVEAGRDPAILQDIKMWGKLY